jgi:hypothetical protein
LLELKFTDVTKKRVVRRVVQLSVDNIKLRANANDIAKIFTHCVHPVELLEQAVASVAESGIPLRKINNNFWAKYIHSLAQRNPEWCTEHTTQLVHEDFREFIAQAFEDYNSAKCKEFYKSIKAATLKSSSSQILNVYNTKLRAIYCPALKNQLVDS